MSSKSVKLPVYIERWSAFIMVANQDNARDLRGLEGDDHSHRSNEVLDA